MTATRQDRATAWLAADPHAQTLGVRLISAQDEEVILELTVAEEHCNSHGSLHGGVSFSVADIGLATISNLAGPSAVAIDVHMVYTAAAQHGETVRASCTPLRRGRTLATYRVELTVIEADNSQRLIGSFTGTVMVLTP